MAHFPSSGAIAQKVSSGLFTQYFNLSHLKLIKFNSTDLVPSERNTEENFEILGDHTLIEYQSYKAKNRQECMSFCCEIISKVSKELKEKTSCGAFTKTQ